MGTNSENFLAPLVNSFNGEYDRVEPFKVVHISQDIKNWFVRVGTLLIKDYIDLTLVISICLLPKNRDL